MKDYSQTVSELFDSQLRDWDLARDNYHQLDNVRARKIFFAEYEITVQFNPGRITSSAAKIDTKSIEARPCFLCDKNRPVQQRGIRFEEHYVILINPFPIFKKHLTIVSDTHTAQRIAGSFMTILGLAQALPEYVIFYNGPQCGASAPDHLHFQAGNKGFLPIENDFENKSLCSKVAVDYGAELWSWQKYGRGIMTLKGTDKETLAATFRSFYTRFALTQPDRPEPMLNILASCSDGTWTIHVIPRKLHRPACYFAEGNDKILLSPASVDMGGVFITPREEDFIKISATDISGIFMQTCLTDKEISLLTADIL